MFSNSKDNRNDKDNKNKDSEIKDIYKTLEYAISNKLLETQRWDYSLSECMSGWNSTINNF